MIIKKMYNTLIETPLANINLGLNTDTTFTVTIKLIDFNGDPVIDTIATVEVFDGVFSNNDTTYTSITDTNGEFNVDVTASEEVFLTCNDASLVINVYRDTGWQTPTFQSGWSNYDSTHPLKWRCVDKFVEIRGMVKKSSATTPDTTAEKIASIPSAFLPTQGVNGIHMAGFNQSNPNKFLMEITSGGIHFQRYGMTSTNTQCPANTCLNICISYLIG